MSADSRQRQAADLRERILRRLDTGIIGKPLLVLPEAASTNDVVKSYASEAAPEGLAVLALTQTKGRGRQGRVWESASGQGVYLSVLLRPGMAAGEVSWLAILGGVAAFSAMQEVGVRNLSIKWPNDVLAGGRKICGVLVEPRVGEGGVDFAVVGVGANVSQDAAAWSDSLKGIATSCHMEGVAASYEDVAAALLGQLDEWYARWRSGRREELLNFWADKTGSERMPVIE